MRTGSIYDVVEVLKSLTFLARSKNLSFREKRMLDRAKFLVISEISEVAREKTECDRTEGRHRARALLLDQDALDRARQGRQGRADDARHRQADRQGVITSAPVDRSRFEDCERPGAISSSRPFSMSTLIAAIRSLADLRRGVALRRCWSGRCSC